LNDYVQVANTENPLLCAKMWGPMSQLMANLVLKFQVVATIATGARMTKISLTHLN